MRNYLPRRYLRLAATVALVAPAVVLGAFVSPVQAAATSLDASVVMTGGEGAKPGKVNGFNIVVRSTVPTASYRLSVKTPVGFSLWEFDVNNGWECAVVAEHNVDCTYKRAATSTPLPVNVAFVFPVKPGTFTITASVQTTEADGNTANNSSTRTITTTATTPVPATGKITGRIWNDADGDGRKDAAEKGIVGTRVVLVRYHGDSLTEAGHTTTGRDGTYTFAGLAPSNPAADGYIVLAAAPDPSWRFTKKDVGSNTGDSDLTPYVKSDHDAAYDSYFPKGARIGYSGPLQVTPRGTVVIDGGVVSTTKPGATLPVTGAPAGFAAGAGGLLLVGGLGLTVLGRRRRPVLAA